MTGRPGQTRPLTWTNKALSWEKICKLIFFQILCGIWWHCVSREHYLLVLISTWLYSVGRGQHWLLLGVTGSEQGGTGCQYDEPSENIWFAWSKPSNHWIFEEGKSDDGQTDTQTHRQTDRISSCRLDPFCRRGRVKTENLPAKVFITWSIVIWIILTKKKHRIWKQDSKNKEP